MDTAIELKKGFGNLHFGETMEQIMEKLGKPDEIEQIGEEVEMPTSVLHYYDKEISLFFETAPQEILVCINVDTPQATLFGETIMGKSSSEIAELMKRNNILGETLDKETWGEERMSYEDYSIDFYFTDDKLESVTIGK